MIMIKERVCVCGGWYDTRLCFPPVGIRGTGATLLLAGVEISKRIVAFMSQGAQLALGFYETCARPLFVRAKLK
jgi:hypothetical protein